MTQLATPAQGRPGNQGATLLTLQLPALPITLDWAALDGWLQAWLEQPFAEAAGPLPPAADRLAARIAAATGAVLRGCCIPLAGAPALAAGSTAVADGWHCTLQFAVPDGVAAAPLQLAAAACRHWLLQLATRPPSGDAVQPFFDYLSRELLPQLLPHAIAAPSSMALLQAATAANVPWRHEGNGVFQLGWGARLRHAFTSRLDSDSSIGIRVAGNKQLSAQWLQAAGLPAARHLPAGNPQEALAAARQLGWPLVIKPLARDRGEGVSVNLRDDAALLAAFSDGSRFGLPLLVEQQVAGDCHRLLVVAGEVMYIVKRLPVAVQGDGRSSIRALIDAANQRARQLPPWRRLPPLLADAASAACLHAAGWQLEAVPPAGQWLALRDIESSADGGRDEDMLACAHADNLALAVRAAALFGLEMAGIDLITPDIRQPWHRNGAIINEVNAAPALGASESSLLAMPRLLQRLFPRGGRIPLEVFVGGERALAAARQRREQLARDGLACYLASAQQCEDAAGQPHPLLAANWYQRCLALLNDRSVAALVLAISAQEWQQAALPLDRVDRVEHIA
ncbi:hypothetical protein ACFOLG_15290 [Vogesella facilis]|uniref:ATP-grasp domain-containing protein n=1 Tax=Vogesella facilis TaxID=1655232 RepID=A0ABV7RJE5_9NEIS